MYMDCPYVLVLSGFIVAFIRNTAALRQQEHLKGYLSPKYHHQSDLNFNCV
jgi:hypothetical protein